MNEQQQKEELTDLHNAIQLSMYDFGESILYNEVKLKQQKKMMSFNVLVLYAISITGFILIVKTGGDLFYWIALSIIFLITSIETFLTWSIIRRNENSQYMREILKEIQKHVNEYKEAHNVTR